MVPQQPSKPPGIPRWLLRRMTRYQRYFFISGDFEEAYNELIVDKGHFFARHWFWFQTICCLPKYIANQLYWSMAMFNNYFKIVLRNLGKYKGHSFINIFGLAVGMGCCILILLWVRDELSYDRFHENAEKLYRVTEHQYNSSGDYFPVAVTPWPLAEPPDSHTVTSRLVAAMRA